MQFIQLRAWNTGQLLFSGHYRDWKTCLEAAVASGVSLSYAVIEDADIGAANLDGACFDYARFVRCHLRGANLSESSFVKTQFTDCALDESCFVDSVVIDARFTDTTMSACDVDYADFRRAIIGCAEFLKTDFGRVKSLAGACLSLRGQVYPIARGPVFIRGLGLDIVLLDEHVMIGSVVLRKDQIGANAGSLARAFAEHGITPSAHTLQRLWETLRGSEALASLMAA